MASLLIRTIGVLSKVPTFQPFLNRVAINLSVGRTKPRPYPYSLWSPDRSEPPERLVTPEPYITWPGLVDRRYTGRHLPPAPVDDGAAPLPEVERVAELFMRRGPSIPSSRTTALFCFFAQWFTDSFLRTDKDRRRNTSTHEIDLCQIYGLDEETSDVLRERRGGRLRVQPPLPTGVFPARLFDDGGALRPEFSGLPYARGEPGRRIVDGMLPTAFGSGGLTAEELERRKRRLYATGLERGSNTILYAALNTVFVREHNRICGLLAAAHPGWDDDRLFETARNINIVQALKLVIEEYINHLAGLPLKFRLDQTFAEKRNWYRVNRIAIEFNLLYRWHSMIPDHLDLPDGGKLDAIDYRFNNERLEAIGVEPLFAAASRRPAGRVGLRNVPAFMWNAEVSALRFARDFRLRPFNAYRARFGLAPHRDWDALTGDPALSEALRGLYGTVDRLEFLVGLFAEKHDGRSSFGELLRTMVAVDAFSQVFTNPLLSAECRGQADAFGSIGVGIIEGTGSLEDIVRRNAPEGAAPAVAARFHL